jgi:hypothetical protein
MVSPLVKIAPQHRGERGFGAQDGAADRFGNLRQDGVAERLDDQAGGSRPASIAERKARVSQPGG